MGVPAPVHDRDPRFFLVAWFLYPLIEANFEMFGVETHGGFVFGVIVAMVLARAGRIAPKAALPSCAVPTEPQDRDAIAGAAAQGER